MWTMCRNNTIHPHTQDEIAVSIQEKEAKRRRRKKGFNYFLLFFLSPYSRFCPVLLILSLHQQQVVCTYRMTNNLIKSIEKSKWWRTKEHCLDAFFSSSSSSLLLSFSRRRSHLSLKMSFCSQIVSHSMLCVGLEGMTDLHLIWSLLEDWWWCNILSFREKRRLWRSMTIDVIVEFIQ